MYIHVGWCIGKCPLYRGVLYSDVLYQRFHCSSVYMFEGYVIRVHVWGH